MTNRLSELPSSPTSQLQTLGTISSSLSLMSDSPDSPDSSSSLPPSHVTARENEALRTWMEKLNFAYVTSMSLRVCHSKGGGRLGKP